MPWAAGLQGVNNSATCQAEQVAYAEAVLVNVTPCCGANCSTAPQVGEGRKQHNFQSPSAWVTLGCGSLLTLG